MAAAEHGCMLPTGHCELRMRNEGYCSCPVCMYVCVHHTAASHIGITKERYQRILCNTGIVLIFADFPKNASFKVMA